MNYQLSMLINRFKQKYNNQKGIIEKNDWQNHQNK